MTHEPPAFGDDDLHALVDGQLDPERAVALMAWLQARPDQAARVAQWQAQRLALRRLHREMEIGATPAALERPLRAAAPRRLPLAAAAALLLAISAGAGWWAGRSAAVAPEVASPAFTRDAALAHVVFVPEIRHPVEVGASDEAHLVQWLGRRLGMPLRAPVLQAQGYRLLGGRLLPGDAGPSAQFMYEQSGGRRVTLYLSTFPPDGAPKETAFRSLRHGDVESFYWIEGRFGYVLSGELPAAELQVLAREVHRQMAR